MIDPLCRMYILSNLKHYCHVCYPSFYSAMRALSSIKSTLSFAYGSFIPARVALSTLLSNSNGKRVDENRVNFCTMLCRDVSIFDNLLNNYVSLDNSVFNEFTTVETYHSTWPFTRSAVVALRCKSTLWLSKKSLKGLYVKWEIYQEPPRTTCQVSGSNNDLCETSWTSKLLFWMFTIIIKCL